MSRCFPFLREGYIRKTIADDPDFLKKEKHKEKKHKKEKKDRERKEGKEKREKDKSDENHNKEKKDKKDKHKEKKKKKEKHHDKDKHKTDGLLPNEKRVVGLPGSQVSFPSEKSKDRTDERTVALVEKRAAGFSASHNGGSFGKSNHLASETKSIKCTPEFEWKSTDEEKRHVNHMHDRNLGTERKKDGMIKLEERSPGLLVNLKDRVKEKATLAGRADGRVVSGEARSSGITQIPNSIGMVQNRVGIARPMEQKIEQRVEGKDKNRKKEIEDGKGDKRKDNDRVKEKRKEEKVKATNEQKPIEQSRKEHGSKNHVLKSGVKDGNKKDSLGAQNTVLQNIPRNSNHSSGAINNLGKRKDMVLNGIYDEHSTRPNKVAKTMSSTHPPTMENGRSLYPSQIPAAVTPAIYWPGPTIKVDPTLVSDGTQQTQHMNVNIKADAKEQKINGMITQPCLSTSKVVQKPESPPVCARQPHPDTKYLHDVFSVPKLDERFDFDDQEWLFNSSQIKKRPEVDSSGVDNMQQVWAKALWLEPVDIHALPYVIPH